MLPRAMRPRHGSNRPQPTKPRDGPTGQSSRRRRCRPRRAKVAEAVERRYAALVELHEADVSLRRHRGRSAMRTRATSSSRPAATNRTIATRSQHSGMHSEPIYVVARVDMVRMYVDIPEMFASYVQRGDRGSRTLQALNDAEIRGACPARRGRCNVQTRTLAGRNRPREPERPDLARHVRLCRSADYTQRRDVRTALAATVELGNQNCCYLLEKGKAVRDAD